MIAIVDCNSFYVSCERLFDPSIENQPVIVLSNNDGCAISRSDEAKAVGVNMGMPLFMMQDIIERHKVKVFSSNYTLYGDMSNRVMKTLSRFAPSTEIYSIDEAFLDFTGLDVKRLDDVGKELKRTVRQYTGIPVSVGVAATKTLAKAANRYAKMMETNIGVHYLNSQQKIDEVLQFTPVGDIWGIGKQHQKFLQSNGINTAADLVKAPDEWIRKNLSVVGQRMVNELRGIPCIKWEEEPQPKQGICTSRSFGFLVEDKQHLREAIANYASNVALKLRKQKGCTKHLHVFIQTNPFRTEEKQYFRSVDMELPVATNCSRKVIHYALKCLDIIYASGYKYLKAGVIATEIVPQHSIQFNLFDEQGSGKNEKLMRTIDKINGSFGKDMVRFAVQGYDKKWKLRANHMSQRFTTNWEELLTIEN